MFQAHLFMGRKIKYMKCDTHEPCHECRKGDAGSIWRAIGCRRGTLGSETRRMRICPQYKGCTFRGPFPSGPEAERDDCQQRMTDPLVWKGDKRTMQGNVDKELLAQRGICRPFAEMNQSFEPPLFGDSSAKPDHFSIDSLQSCLATILSYLQGKDLLQPSFQISAAASSLLDIPALLIFVSKTYTTSEYVCITSPYYHPVNSNLAYRAT
jgi:hypothetical protein